MQVCDYASMQEFKYANMQICKDANVQVYKYGFMSHKTESYAVICSQCSHFVTFSTKQ